VRSESYLREDAPSRRLHLAVLVDEVEERGGSELHLLSLLRGLGARGFRCSMLVLGRAGLLTIYREAGIEALRWPVRRVLSPKYPLQVARLAHWLRSERVDVVETVHTAADLLGPLAARFAGGVPCVSSRRDLGIFRAPRHLAFARLTNRWVRAFLAPSEAVREATCEQEGVAPASFHIIPNGVDTERFRPGGAPDLRAELGIAPEVPVVGNVASLSKAKQPLVLLEAFAGLRSGAAPDAHLVFAGTGPLRTPLEEAVRARGLSRCVHLLGSRPDPERVYATLDLLALPSSSEGLSNTVLEAMASGLPVVASAVGGNVELVQQGKTGLLVPSGDVPALQQAFRAVLTAPGRGADLGAAGRRCVVEEHSLDRMVDAHASFFRGLAPRGPRAGAGQ